MKSYELGFLDLLLEHKAGIIKDATYFMVGDNDMSVSLEGSSLGIGDYEGNLDDWYDSIVINGKDKFLVTKYHLNSDIRTWYDDRLKDMEEK